MRKAWVVMGVSGCGKSTVGQMLAEKLGGNFLDADDYHAAESVAKMREGIPLTDEDRWVWLDRLNGLLQEAIQNGDVPVLACSALKEVYRQRIAAGGIPVEWIHLRGSFEQIRARMESRPGHFMPAALLQSQFDALEEPAYARVFDVSRPAGDIVDEILGSGGEVG